MTIAFNCSECEAPLKVADNLAGKKCKCPKCGVVNPVPVDEPGDAEPVPPKAGSGVRKKPDADEDAVEDLGEVKGKKAKAKKVRAKKGGGTKWLIVSGVALLLGGGLLTCVCGGTGFSLWMWFPEYLPAFLGGTPGELRYMPTGTTHIESHRVDQERNSKFFKEVEAAKPSKPDLNIDFGEKAHGIPSSNIDRTLSGGSGSDRVTVVITKSAVKSADILSKLKADSKAEFEEEKAKDGKYTINKPKGGFGQQSFCVVDSKTVLYSSDPKTLKAVLERDKMPEFSSAMQKAMKKADFSKTNTLIATGGGAKEELIIGGGDRKSPKPEYLVIEQDLGSDRKVRMVAEFKDNAEAKDAQKAFDEMILKQKGELEKKGLAKEVEISSSVSGNILTIQGRESTKVEIEKWKNR